MASVDVVSVQGGSAETVDLAPAVFEAAIRPHLFHAEVRRQLARRRSGTHATRNRAGVSGGGSKPYRQKGTGRARQGTIRAPQYQGGGVVFGPVPRRYDHKLPKKIRAAALRGALSLRQSEGALIVVDGLAVGGFKTKRVLEILEAAGVGGESVLIVIPEKDVQLEVSARNLTKVGVVRVEGLNVYDVLRRTKLLVVKDAIALIEKRLANPGVEVAP